MKRFITILALTSFVVLSALTITTAPVTNSAVDDGTVVLTIGGVEVRTQMSAIADTIGGNNTLLADPKDVSATSRWFIPQVRPRIVVIAADTAYAKIVVPAMDDGDVVLGVGYVPYDSMYVTASARYPIDMTDSTAYDADTIQLRYPSIPIDSGLYVLMFHDVN